MSIDIIYKEQNEDLFWKYWNQITKKASYAYFQNTIKIYLLTLKNKLMVDKRFIYLENKIPLAAVFLPIEKQKNNISISLNNNFIPSPIFDASVSKKVFLLIEKISQEIKVKKIMFAIDPLGPALYNYLQKYGFIDSSILSYVIDLNGVDLLSLCRKGNRNEIKKILTCNDYSLFYIDKKKPNCVIFKDYIKLHHLCSGKKTRPDESFDLQFDNLKKGNGVLFGLSFKKKNLGFVYFEFNQENAIYYSGSDDPKYNFLPLYHVLIYSAMKYLKKHGIKYIDTGQPSSPSAQFGYTPDKKQLNIALFKRGFPGDYKNYYRGIKYFSKDLFKEDMDIFMKNYLNQINYE